MEAAEETRRSLKSEADQFRELAAANGRALGEALRELEALRARVMVVPDEREAFEAWHCSKFATEWQTGKPTRDMHNGKYDEEYGPEEQQIRWECWQARAHLNGKTVSEGLLREAKRHLGNWLELHECECEGGLHYCGREQVAKTHRELRALLDEGKEVDGHA
ncbi:hypothetical protein D9M71_439710 [compost metagenome]